MIKMVVLDIDGTILGKNMVLSENLKKCFLTLIERRIKVVLATGRMYFAAVHLAQELQLETPIICYQGGYIRNFRENDDLIREKLVAPEFAPDIIKILKENKIHINLYADDILYVEEDDDIIKNYCKDRVIPYRVVDFSALNPKGYNKILGIDYDPEKIAKIIDVLNKKYGEKLHITRSTPYFCEISNKSATKGDSVKFLADLWGIEKSEIMAIGDQDNDIEMLMAAGVKVAMGNGTEKLKSIADFTTKSVDEDGAVFAINKFILEQGNDA